MADTRTHTSFKHRLSRWGYSGLWAVALPVLVGRVAWRARSNSRQWLRFGERLGNTPEQSDRPLWIHAASVGEVMAIVPLVKALKDAEPQLPIVVSTVTLTGADRVAEQLKGLAQHIFLPYDLPCFVAKAFKQLAPRALVLVETEIWPNLITKANEAQVPVVLVNARLSEKSAKGYRKISALVEPALKGMSHIYAQFDADAQRLIGLGADPDKVTVTGSIKFDVSVDEKQRQSFIALREQWGATRPVWLLASTHETEEALGLETFHKLRKEIPELLLVIAPRHPERFDEVAELVKSQSLQLVRRSQTHDKPEALDSRCDVYLSDTLGELAALYACADAVLIGGSFKPVGGHNPLEPAYHGIAPVTGPHIHNFATMFAEMVEQEAAFIVADQEAAVRRLSRLLVDKPYREAHGAKARAYLEAHSGVLDKVTTSLVRLNA
ncbi:MAG: lipid IV(A) 3-deoxy-D-manno-octulosonic acid transferase [Pontibacterium sp.]